MIDRLESLNLDRWDRGLDDGSDDEGGSRSDKTNEDLNDSDESFALSDSDVSALTDGPQEMRLPSISSRSEGSDIDKEQEEED